MQPQRDHRVMHGTTADPLAGIVGAKLDRILAPGYALLGPEQLARAGFIRDEIMRRVPVWPGIEDYHREPRFGELRPDHPTASASADDAEIHFVPGPVAHRHGLAVNARCQERPVTLADGRCNVAVPVIAAGHWRRSSAAPDPIMRSPACPQARELPRDRRRPPKSACGRAAMRGRYNRLRSMPLDGCNTS